MRTTTTDRASLPAYLCARFLYSAGATLILLDATEITNLAGGENGALVSAALLTSALVCGALCVPFVTKAAHRVGVRRTVALTGLAIAASCTVAAAGLFSGLSPIVLVFCLVPLVGAVEAFMGVLGPLVTQAYFGMEIARSYSRMRIVDGFGVAAAGLVAGTVIQATQPGRGALVAAILTVPFVLVLWLVDPAEEPAPVQAGGHSIRGQAVMFRSYPQLRVVAVIAGASALLIAPLPELIIPITASLDQMAVITGAGLLLATQSIGTLATPWLIHVWASAPKGSNLRASLIGVLLAGTALVGFAVSAAFLRGSAELIVWAGIGVVFGVGFGLANASGLGSAVDMVPKDLGAQAVAARQLVFLALLPVGLLLWGGLISFVSIQSALVVGAVGLLTLAFLLRGRFTVGHRLTAPE